MEEKAEYITTATTPSGKSAGSGRPPNPRGKILSNGLFESQSARLHQLAKNVNLPMAMFHRNIIDWYFAEYDSMMAHLAEQEEVAKQNKETILGEEEAKQLSFFSEFPLIFTKENGEQNDTNSTDKVAAV